MVKLYWPRRQDNAVSYLLFRVAFREAGKQRGFLLAWCYTELVKTRKLRSAKVQRPGSRGGHVVGFSKSGDPIYASKHDIKRWLTEAPNDYNPGLYAVSKLGGDPDLAHRLISAWKGSARSEDAVRWRTAINHKFTDRERRYLENKFGHKLNKIIHEAHHDPILQRTVKAITLVSQAAHEESHQELYRGLQGKKGGLGSHVAALRLGSKARSVDIGGTAEFTESREIAHGFSGKTVVKQIVPTENIAYSHRAFSKNGAYDPDEQSVIVKTGKRIRITKDRVERKTRIMRSHANASSTYQPEERKKQQESNDNFLKGLFD